MDFRHEFKSKPRKHRRLSSRDKSGPSYFWFVVPESIFDRVQAELPDYAGLIRIWCNNKYWKMEIAKSAPRIHGIKMTQGQKEKCIRLLSYKLKNVYRRNDWPEVVYSTDRMEEANGTNAAD